MCLLVMIGFLLLRMFAFIFNITRGVSASAWMKLGLLVGIRV